jgi:ribose/xylose/arabinose/galactoside ABC-type transport system permease subunit
VTAKQSDFPRRLSFLPKPGAIAGRQLANLVGLGLLVAIFQTQNHAFLTYDNVLNILTQASAVATVGGFFTILMVGGGVDLSVSGVLALSGVVAVRLVNAGFSVPLAFVVAVLLGLGVGVINGVFVAIVRVNTIIATLATLYVTVGLAQALTGAQTIAPSDAGYARLGNATINTVPILVVIMVIAVAIAMIIERRAALGRNAVLLGSNPQAARLSGVPTRGTLVALFALTGAAAGWAGVMVSSQLGAADPFADANFAFDIIIATLIGGTSIMGGEGTVVGMLLGALIVSSANVGMDLLGVPSFDKTVLTGCILLAAVSLDALMRRRRVGGFRIRIRRRAIVTDA